MNTRRDFFRASLFLVMGTQLGWGKFLGREEKAMNKPNKSNTPNKPRRLQPGQTIGLVNPAGAVFIEDEVCMVEELLANLGFRSVRGRHLLARYGYLAGNDAERAADVNAMFADSHINAILAVRGGWGCNRILPLLDYELIKRNPKIIAGYSDITALLLAIYAKTGLVTFHGPVGISTWNDFSWNGFKSVLVDGEAPLLKNPQADPSKRVQTENRIRTIHSGQAEGILSGGNLSILTAMVGSPYLPAWKGKLLFIEEIGEEIYRVDRMLTQLSLAGILQQLNGVILGNFVDCKPEAGYGSLTLDEVFRDHLGNLGIPVFYGAMIGHIEDKFTIPIGIPAVMDAAKGTIELKEPAVI